MLKFRWKYWAALSLVPGGLVAAWRIPSAFEVLHSFVGIFGGGRSNAKVAIFFVYLLLLILLHAKKAKGHGAAARDLRKPILFLLLLLYGAGLAAFLIFYLTHGLRLNDFMVVFNNGELSSTMLWHSHILKGAFGLPLNWLGLGAQENYDTGLAFVHLLPGGLLYGAMLAGAVAVIFFFLYYPVARRKEIVKNKVFFTVLYAVISFSLLKNVFDGGLLNRETPPALAGLLLLFWPHRPVARHAAITILVVYLVFTLAFARFGGLPNNEQLLPILAHSLVFAVLLGLLFLAAYRERVNPKLWLLSGLAIFAIGIAVYTDSWPVRTFRNIPVDGGEQTILALYRDQGASGTEYQFLEKIGDLKFYSYRPATAETVGALLQRHGLLDNIVPVAVPGKTCFPQGPASIISFDALTTQLPDPSPLRFQMARLEQIKLAGDASRGWHRYRVRTVLYPCTPRALNVIQELLRSQGLTTFILTNPQFTDTYDF